MNNPFHTIGMVAAICALVSAGVSWGFYLSRTQAPSILQDVSPLIAPVRAGVVSSQVASSEGSAATATVIAVYPPTHENPSYNVVITQSSRATQIHPIVVVP